MNKSTGGFVLRDKTSVKEGSRLLRLLAQSLWFFSSFSMLVDNENVSKKRCSENGLLKEGGPVARDP